MFKLGTILPGKRQISYIELDIVEEEDGGEGSGCADDVDGGGRVVDPLLKLREEAACNEGPQKHAHHLHTCTQGETACPCQRRQQQLQCTSITVQERKLAVVFCNAVLITQQAAQ